MTGVNIQPGKRAALTLLAFACCLLFFTTDVLPEVGRCDQDCSLCHVLSVDDASDILKVVKQNVKIVDIQAAPLKGLWEIVIEHEGKKSIVYLDFAKKTLVSGSLLDLTSKKNITKQKIAALNKIDVSTIPLTDALVLGNSDAANKIIAFYDPD